MGRGGCSDRGGCSARPRVEASIAAEGISAPAPPKPGPRGIPLDPEQRQDELRDTYRELDREIKRWRFIKERAIQRRSKPLF
jgi:hypothetical protein